MSYYLIGVIFLTLATIKVIKVAQVNFPIGMVDGLPCGAQLMAGNFRDYLLTQAVHQFQQATDFHCHHASAQGVD